MSEAPLPRISIVTPSYNQGDFVAQTVRSVFDQRYPDLEYLFLDGGSTDDTLERIAPWRDRFAHFRSAPDGGQSAAIAEGFERSTGDILAYLNSDDVLLPGALHHVAGFFARHPEVDFVYSHRCVVDEAGRVVGHWILPPHSHFLMRRWDLIPQETCFWRRRLLERRGNVDPSFRFAMDYDLFVRYMNGGNFRRLDRFLAAFRVHAGAKTSTLIGTVGQSEMDRVRRQYRLALPPFVGDLFSLSVQWRSARFARGRRAIAGLPPGIGYPVDAVWGRAPTASP